MTDRQPGFATLAVHAGAQPDPTTGARATPIYQTTSYVFESVDHAASLFGLQAFGNIYTRITNPTNAVLEERVAALEGGTAALAVASGHAAQMLVMHALMMPGDEFVASKKLYGGSINQFNHSYKSFGWNVVWADPDDLQSFERAVSPKTKAIFVESIANPGGVITDIAAIAQIARRAGVAVETVFAAGLPAVLGDRIQLQQVLLNLMQNAVDHAFPHEEGDTVDGNVAVRLAREDHELVVQVVDDGVGLPEGFDPEATSTLGMQLVVQLTRQLRGELIVGKGRKGASFTITFPLKGAKCHVRPNHDC